MTNQSETSTRATPAAVQPGGLLAEDDGGEGLVLGRATAAIVGAATEAVVTAAMRRVRAKPPACRPV